MTDPNKAHGYVYIGLGLLLWLAFLVLIFWVVL